MYPVEFLPKSSKVVHLVKGGENPSVYSPGLPSDSKATFIAKPKAERRKNDNPKENPRRQPN